MTSFIAACGSGRSTSFIPAVPAAWSVTTIAFIIIFSSVIGRFAEYVPALKSLFAACRSRTNADDRLPLDPLGLDPLGRIERGDGIVEGRYFADVRPQPSV